MSNIKPATSVQPLVITVSPTIGPGQDGKRRSGLSVMSWHCRIAAIGRNRPKRDRKPDDELSAAAPRRNDFHNDEIGF
jgi:hypothetical protein